MEHFKDHPYDILYGKNGEEGYQIALAEIPDLILMDWTMPVMDGLEATVKLKEHPDTADIPVVMISGVMTTVENLKEALHAGAVDYIHKPFDPVELTSRVQSMLRLGRSFAEIKQKNIEIQKLMSREKELLEEQLGQKEREITMQAMHALEKDKFLNELQKRVKTVESDLGDEVPSSLKEISKDIKSQITAEKSWDNFMLHFEQVHPRFFQKLKGKFTQLTNNDLRLAGYVKLGMDNKEIARLIGVEIGTVKTNLHRLKQKFGLSVDERLREVIQSF